MIPKARRIPRAVFELPARSVSTMRSSAVIVRSFALPGGVKGPRYAVSVSKKDVPMAVERNRLRRRYYRLVSLFTEVAKDGRAYQIIVKKPASALSFLQAREDLSSILPKVV